MARPLKTTKSETLRILIPEEIRLLLDGLVFLGSHRSGAELAFCFIREGILRELETQSVQGAIDKLAEALEVRTPRPPDSLQRIRNALPSGLSATTLNDEEREE